MAEASLVVIEIVNKLHIGTNEAKHEGPVTRNIHRPKAFQLSMQGMKTITRAIHI